MSFTVTDLVQLPRVGAQGGRALGTQVLAAAQAETLPKSVVKCHLKLKAAHAALETAIVVQFGAPTGEKSDSDPVVQELDRILDNCWSGIDDRLLGLTKLPAGTPGVAEAASLRRRHFPAGLTFLKLAYKLEWSESQTRLHLIEIEKLGPEVDRLVGKQFLPALKEAHANYGRALGMSEPLTDVPGVPQVRGAFDLFIKALRDYVVKVVASVEEDEPNTQLVADALLAPIEAWAVANKRSRDAAPSAPAPETATGGAGTPADK
jgi:hypothetical protein